MDHTRLSIALNNLNDRTCLVSYSHFGLKHPVYPSDNWTGGRGFPFSPEGKHYENAFVTPEPKNFDVFTPPTRTPEDEEEKVEKPRKVGKIVTAASNGQLYKTKMCYYHTHGTCSWGASCHHAHSSDELRSKPDLVRPSRSVVLVHCFRPEARFDINLFGQVASI